MSIYAFKERLLFFLKNETDGFMATTLEPQKGGLFAYIVFNCYGTERQHFLIPPKHRKMIVEIAKDIGGNTRCGRFKWKELIPIEVSESPRILLRGGKLKKAYAVFSKHEWESIFNYIKQNIPVIKRHWLGEGDSLELFNELERFNGC